MSEAGSAFSNANTIQVRLPRGFSQTHRQILQGYLTNQEFTGGDAWVLLIQAMDLLRHAEVIANEHAETFAVIYDRLVDAVYADKLITDLLTVDDPENQCESLRATVSRQIMVDLKVTGLWRSDTRETQLLVAFCLYWWKMFVRGYAFELAIYRDLHASGIVYTAHNLRNRQERFSGSDLSVLGFHGDIKNSTYFVQTQRSEPLKHDFYITRMYNSSKREWQRPVWLIPAFWRLLNGAPTPVDYTAIWQVLPGVAQILLRGRSFVVVLYTEWKQRLLIRQQGEKRNG